VKCQSHPGHTRLLVESNLAVQAIGSQNSAISRSLKPCPPHSISAARVRSTFCQKSCGRPQSVTAHSSFFSKPLYPEHQPHQVASLGGHGTKRVTALRRNQNNTNNNKQIFHGPFSLTVLGMSIVWRLVLIWAIPLSFRGPSCSTSSILLLVRAQHQGLSSCQNDADCRNGGQCDSSSCVCATGFRGKFCDLTCPIRCENGGQCRLVDTNADEHGGIDLQASDFACDCPSDLYSSGPLCQEEKSPPSTGAPSSDSNGRTAAATAAEATSKTRGRSAAMIIAAAAVGVAVLVLLLVVQISFRHHQQKRRSTTTTTPKRSQHDEDQDGVQLTRTTTTRVPEREIEIDRLDGGLVVVASTHDDNDDGGFVPPKNNIT
jgi:hypothetical protein